MSWLLTRSMARSPSHGSRPVHESWRRSKCGSVLAGGPFDFFWRGHVGLRTVWAPVFSECGDDPGGGRAVVGATTSSGGSGRPLWLVPPAAWLTPRARVEEDHRVHTRRRVAALTRTDSWGRHVGSAGVSLTPARGSCDASGRKTLLAGSPAAAVQERGWSRVYG
jgi:hypothetical protein